MADLCVFVWPLAARSGRRYHCDRLDRISPCSSTGLQTVAQGSWESVQEPSPGELTTGVEGKASPGSGQQFVRIHLAGFLAWPAEQSQQVRDAIRITKYTHRTP